MSRPDAPDAAQEQARPAPDAGPDGPEPPPDATDAGAGGSAVAGDDGSGGAPSVEDLVTALEQVTAERDQFLALAREKQAEFENYRKQMMRRQTEHLEQAAATLVEKVLPVLDAFDSGLAHGEDALAPLHTQLLGVLEREGLERVAPLGEKFDPSEHEAVVHEPGDGGDEVVTEVMRSGYRWKGRVLRPAMVKVRS